ncbi:hypothetical protein GC174_04840 [bacterium]|nr:hypothetical protein [bacterium]
MQFLPFLKKSNTAPALMVLALFALYPSPGLAEPPENFSKAIEKPYDISNEAGLQYTKTSRFKQEFAKAVREARDFCKKYKRENPDTRNLAIVSDIDETLLDNRGLFNHVEEFSWPEFIKWVEKADAPNLKQTASFLKWARRNGFSIFLVTGRPEKLRPYTIMNLVKNDIAYDGLYMRPDSDRHSSAIKLKTKVRKEIEEMGFKIVVNIGDQVSDLVGGYALDCQKLPNKMYFVK